MNSEDDVSGWKPHKNNDMNKGFIEGEDVYGWIYRVERFFDVQWIKEKEQ